MFSIFTIMYFTSTPSYAASRWRQKYFPSPYPSFLGTGRAHSVTSSVSLDRFKPSLSPTKSQVHTPWQHQCTVFFCFFKCPLSYSMWSLHLTWPCYVALGRVLIWCTNNMVYILFAIPRRDSNPGPSTRNDFRAYALNHSATMPANALFS